MKSFLNEFKAFAMRGNVVDLAVAVIIGAAFGKIVSSLVDNIVMPLIGLALGGINLRNYSWSIGETTVSYGTFLQNVIDFIIIAFAVFVALKIINRLKKKQAEEPEKSPEPSEDIKLLREIRDVLKAGK